MSNAMHRPVPMDKDKQIENLMQALKASGVTENMCFAVRDQGAEIVEPTPAAKSYRVKYAWAGVFETCVILEEADLFKIEQLKMSVEDYLLNVDRSQLDGDGLSFIEEIGPTSILAITEDN